MRQFEQQSVFTFSFLLLHLVSFYNGYNVLIVTVLTRAYQPTFTFYSVYSYCGVTIWTSTFFGLQSVFVVVAKRAAVWCDSLNSNATTHQPVYKNKQNIVDSLYQKCTETAGLYCERSCWCVHGHPAGVPWCVVWRFQQPMLMCPWPPVWCPMVWSDAFNSSQPVVQDEV